MKCQTMSFSHENQTAGGLRSSAVGAPPTSDPHSSPLHHDDDDGDEDEDEDGVKSPSGPRSDSTHRPAVIPNTEEIRAAKIRRRANRTQRNYIPLDCDGVPSPGRSQNHCSREEEERGFDDDDDHQPDDHERRIEFAPRPKTLQERMAESLGGSDDERSSAADDEEEEEDEERQLWEETQIGKGTKRTPRNRGLSSSSHRPRIPKTDPPVTVSMVKKKIHSKLDAMKELHRRLQLDAINVDTDLETARTSVESLSEGSSEGQLTFYRETAVYVHNLVECLREKVVQVTSLERELHLLLSDQMEALLTQRRQNPKELHNDDLQEQRTSGPERQGLVQSEEEEEEEEGRLHQSPAEADLQKTIAEVMLRSEAVFSDVHEDFSDVRRILRRFHAWRASYGHSYHTAFVSLCLPRMLSPIVRLQLLGWNPLQGSSCEDLENLQWFSAVENFCYGHDQENLENLDRRTLTSVLDQAVLPKMTVFVDLVWDPLSHHQTTCLSDLCHRLKEDHHVFEGKLSKNGQAFVETLVHRLRRCVDEELFFPLREPMESRHKRTQAALTLLATMGQWDSLVPVTSLKELMLDQVLNRYLVLTLLTGTLARPHLVCRKIADSLPRSWFTDVSSALPELQNFENYLVQRVNVLCQQKSPEDPQTRSAVVDLLQVLSRIHCHTSIRTIAQKLHLEDVMFSQQLLNQEEA